MQCGTSTGRGKLALLPVFVIMSRGPPLNFKLPDSFGNDQIRNKQIGLTSRLFWVLQLLKQLLEHRRMLSLPGLTIHHASYTLLARFRCQSQYRSE